ncbi:MAG TPA: L,D-transpeptidase family protein [Thermomicrobiales bacterium]|jgi:uncharacterized protein YgiM (DUF1202 family)|nr:L,D-transpeptidase family protein [Thermomicrobiales bacterium]
MQGQRPDHDRWATAPGSRILTRRRLLATVPALAGLAAGVHSAAAGTINPIGTPTPSPSPDPVPSTIPLGEPSASAQPSGSAEATPAPVEPDPVPIGVTSDTDAGEFVYFPDTGHNLGDPFRSIWEQFGAEEVLGAPLSEQRFDDGTGWLMQFFPGIVFGYDPTLETPVVAPLLFTDSQMRGFLPASGQEQGARVEGRFRNFIEANGGSTLTGTAMSAAFEDEDGMTRQVFQNVVLQETTGGVRLYPAWREIVMGSDVAGDPAFTPQPPTGGETFLVNASDGLNLRELPDTSSGILVLVPENAEYIAVPGDHDEWVPGYVNGYAGWLAREWLTEPPALPERSTSDWNINVWQGASLGHSNVREQPTTQARTVRELEFGDGVEATAWVKGEEVDEGSDTWAQIGQNEFVYARNVGRNAPVEPTPIPEGAPGWGKWIDVNLTQQLMIAYDGTTPVRVAVTTTGMAGWETPPGWFATSWRVANETMTSGAIGAENFFDLRNVLFTQYFTDRGHAIHFAWWRTKETIGRPGSHGCLNLLLDDSRFFWDWAPIGTPVICHY